MAEQQYEEIHFEGKMTPAVAVTFRDGLLRWLKTIPQLNQMPRDMDLDDIYNSNIVIWHRPIWEAATRGYECFDRVPDVKPGLLNNWTVFMLDDGEWCGNHDDGFWSPLAFIKVNPTSGRFFLLLPLHENGSVQWLCTAFSDKGFQESKSVKDGGPLTRYMSRLCAEVAFLQQPFVDVVPHIYSRPERRRAQKSNVKLADIRIVRLRKSEAKYTDHSDSSSREYSCHWLVGAHWRRPRPSMKEQRPVYVRPYVKGPADKPFRAPRETVHIAVR